MDNKLLKKGLRLEYITLIWNVFECVLILSAGIMASSVAMVGFGIDSVIEIFASIIVIWQLKAINKDKEVLAERLIGIAFILLAIYIGAQSYHSFIAYHHPKSSLFGILTLIATALAMFSLAYQKGIVGNKINNRILQKEAKVTLIDGCLATSVLIGILLSTLFGLWWADPLAGFVLVIYALIEGFHALQA